MSIESRISGIDSAPNKETKEESFLHDLRQMITTLEEELEGIHMEYGIADSNAGSDPVTREAFEPEYDRIRKQEKIAVAKLEACERLLRLLEGVDPSEIDPEKEKPRW